MKALNTTFWWPGLTLMVEAVVGGCGACKRLQLPVQVVQELSPTTIPTGPGKILCIDLITFTRSHEGNRYVIVAQDWFSKWVEVRAVPDKTAATVAKFFKEEILWRSGCPACVLTDQGTEFKGLLDEALRLCDIKHRVTSPYNPQANGLVERFNRTLVAALRASMERTDVASGKGGWEISSCHTVGFPTPPLG